MIKLQTTAILSMATCLALFSNYSQAWGLLGGGFAAPTIDGSGNVVAPKCRRLCGNSPS